MQIGREEVKLFTFADDAILYIRDNKHSIRKLLEMINNFTEVTSCKTKLQNSIFFLYINNVNTYRERDHGHTTHNRLKNFKLFRKEMKDIYSERFNSPKKEDCRK